MLLISDLIKIYKWNPKISWIIIIIWIGKCDASNIISSICTLKLLGLFFNFYHWNIILRSPMDPLLTSWIVIYYPLAYILAILVMMGCAYGLHHFLHSDNNPRRTPGARDLSLAVVYAYHPEDGVTNGVGNAAPALQLISH